MPPFRTVGYGRVASTGQDFGVQLEKLKGSDKVDIGSHGVAIETKSGARRPNPACKILIEAQSEAEPLLRSFDWDMEFSDGRAVTVSRSTCRRGRCR